MQHCVIGVKTAEGKLVGFVDVSLQTSSGSDVALEPLALSERQKKFNDLRPYLCNLLVAPAMRKRGIGSLLIGACEAKACSWGFSELFLHADRSYVPAMKLYINANFEPIQRKDDLLFMRKILQPEGSRPSPRT